MTKKGRGPVGKEPKKQVGYRLDTEVIDLIRQVSNERGQTITKTIENAIKLTYTKESDKLPGEALTILS